MDEIVVPLRYCPSGGSPTLSSGSPSAHWDNIIPIGTLQPAPSMRDVPKLSPVVAHRAHIEPLSGLIFTSESVLTICREGHIKKWVRPAQGDIGQSNGSEVTLMSITSSNNMCVPTIKPIGSNHKPPPAVHRDWSFLTQQTSHGSRFLLAGVNMVCLMLFQISWGKQSD